MLEVEKIESLHLDWFGGEPFMYFSQVISPLSNYAKNGFDKKCQAPTFENGRCLKCKKLPMCMGLCPRDHLAGQTHCKDDAMEESFESSLSNFLYHQFK